MIKLLSMSETTKYKLEMGEKINQMEVPLWLGDREHIQVQLILLGYIFKLNPTEASANLINTIQAFPSFIYSNFLLITF